MKAFLLAMFLLVESKALAQGGPPLTTDDPGTPGDGHWEVNCAVQWVPSSLGSTVQFPLFDVNYGYGDHIQLNLNTSWINSVEYGGGTTSGISVASLGTKWRFIDEEKSGIAVSTYPRVDFHHKLSSDDPNINTPGSRYFLPVEFAKVFGNLGVNPEIGYATYSQGSSEWVYGLALSYAFEKEKEALFEIHGRSSVSSSDRELFYGVGARYSLSESMSVIGTIARAVTAFSDSALFWNFYLGVQLRF